MISQWVMSLVRYRHGFGSPAMATGTRNASTRHTLTNHQSRRETDRPLKYPSGSLGWWTFGELNCWVFFFTIGAYYYIYIHVFIICMHAYIYTHYVFNVPMCIVIFLCVLSAYILYVFLYLWIVYFILYLHTYIYIYRLATMVNPNGKRIYDPVFRPRGPPPSPRMGWVPR